jgi:hypothetical protein
LKSEKENLPCKTNDPMAEEKDIPPTPEAVEAGVAALHAKSWDNDGEKCERRSRRSIP